MTRQKLKQLMRRDWLRNSKRKNAKKAQEAGDLPEEEVEDYSEESSDDESPIAPRVRRVQSLRDHNINFEGGASGFVRKINIAELTDKHTDSEVGKVVIGKCDFFVKLPVLGKNK